jgi:uncharacterized glyoxalase superfamily protein PhnB
MNILTDVLSLIRRSVYAKKAGLDDVLIIGTHEQPEMTGVASPIPYKSVKVIKVRDFKIAAEHCSYANAPAVPTTKGQIYQKTVVDPETDECTVYFRSLKSLSSNLSIAISADNDYVELATTGEPNTAESLGSGQVVYSGKVGETLQFKSLSASGIELTSTANEVTVGPATALKLTDSNGVVWQLGVDTSGNLTTTQV